MKNLIKKITDALAESAIAEIEGPEALRMSKTAATHEHNFKERLEERLVEVAYAEAADYEDIRKSMARERKEIVHPDECQFGDNDLCYVET